MGRRACSVVAAVSVLVLVAGAIVAPVSASGAARVIGAAPRVPVALRELVASLGGDPTQAGSPGYAYLAKLDSHVQELAAGKGDPLGSVRGGLRVTSDRSVLVDVYANGALNASARQLRALGMRITAVSRRDPERMVEGYLPIDAATKVAALESTKAVLSVSGWGTDTGSVTSQGDAVHHGPQARAQGPTGAGVTVGIMSDSINKVSPGVAGSQSTGDLPANVSVLNEDTGGADEGRAMAEIVYDEAPGVTNMVFDTGTAGAATKAAHIADLVNAGADVIADDTFYLGEPFFQDGVVAQAVDAAAANGTAYIAAAGNRARQSWEGRFTLGTNGNNDFGGGDVEQTLVTVRAHATLVGDLQWDEPWGGASTDFDALLFVNGTVCSACSGETDNIASGIPAESFGVTAGASPIQVSLEITRFAGSGTPKMKYILSGNFGSFTIGEHATNSNTINPDAAAARGALAAAAVCWSTSSGNCYQSSSAGLQTPETFSSRGPVVRTRDKNGNPLGTPEVRQKPDVAGADGVATDLSPTSGLNPFFGTSAAAASAAGVAVLAKSARPAITVAQLYAVLTDPTVSLDCTSAAGDPDTDCGSGFLQADKIVTKAADTVAPTVTVTAPANLFQLSTTVTVKYSATDSRSGVASYDVQRRTAAWNGGFSSYTNLASATTATSKAITGSPGHEYCFRVRARDHAGNVSAWSHDRCTVIPLDDRALSTTTAGWTRLSSSAAYRGTLTRSTTKGSNLKLAGAVTDRIALVVETCSSCGSIGVYLNGTLWKTVSTVATTTHYKVIKLPGTFGLRTATIALKDASAGKRVVVDGIGIART